MAFSHTESISGTEHMKNSEPKSCDPYVDSLIRNADAKEARAFLKILKPLPFLIGKRQRSTVLTLIYW